MKSDKGYTGVDISISIVVLFIFVSIIAVLFYNSNTSSKGIKLKSEATSIAINEIEIMKNKTLEDIEVEDIKYRETTQIEEGFFRNIIVQDYHDIDATKTSGIVKKVTVQVKYMFKGKEQSVELSTIITN